MTMLPLAGRVMQVSLAQVNKELRIRVAEELIELFNLKAMEAFKLRYAAEDPIENPKIEVPARKYVTVIINEKLPPGKYPII